MNELVLHTLTPDQYPQWDAFVHQHPNGQFFHLSGWKTLLENTFNHPTHYLYATQNDQWQGILPLGHIHSRLFGNALVSVPFCVAGGALATHPEAQQALERAAITQAHHLGVDYLELRGPTVADHPWQHKTDRYVNFAKPLLPTVEANLKAIPRKQRAMVRKAMQHGLTARAETDISRFYHAYSTSLRNLGTPTLPERFFTELKAIFGDKCRMLTVEHRDAPIASVMSFYHQGTVMPYYGGGNEHGRQLKANDFMYWSLMAQSVDEGCTRFDYGRSKVGSGSYHFKKNWGFTPEPLIYQYALVHAKTMPDINPLNPKYQLFVKLWQRLPLGVSQQIGPMLAKHLV